MTLILRYGLLVLTAVVLQRGLFAELRIDGAAPDVVLVLAVAAGIAGGPERGAVGGFAAGLGLDLLLPSPFGLAALTYLLTGAVVGSLHLVDHRSPLWRVVALSAVGCAFGTVLFAVVGTLVGQSGYLRDQLVTVVLVVSAAGAVLGPVAVRACRWAADEPVSPRRALW